MDSRRFTGNFLIDDNLLAEFGITDFERYRVDTKQQLVQDFFVPDDIPLPRDVDPGTIDPRPVTAQGVSS